MSTMPCVSCSRLVRVGARFCSHCGAAQSVVQPAAPAPAIGPTQRAQALPLAQTQRADSTQLPPALAAQSFPPSGMLNPAPAYAAASVAGRSTLAISRSTVTATVAGLVGGLIATVLLSLLNARAGAYSKLGLALLIGGIVGLCIPGALNTVPGLLAGQARRALRNGLVAAVIGAGVMIAISIGLAWVVPRETIFFQGSFALGLLAWVLFGLALGAVEGLVWRSSKRALLGACGGALGAILAFVTGMLLDNEGAFLLVGPLVGLGANLLPDIFKSAWIDVVNRERRFTINLDKPVIIVGSSDDPQQADVGLYGDRAIAPRHFALEQRGDGYTLTALAQTGAVWVNGAPVQGTAQLQPGDHITVGQAQIAFYTKGHH
jgi:hypothetical protein